MAIIPPNCLDGIIAKNGISAYEAQRQLGVTYKTAWRMLKQIRTLLDEQNDITDLFSDIVELDETYIGGKQKNKHFHKRKKNTMGRSVADKVAVFGILDRNTKKVKAFVVKNTTSATLHPIINSHIKRWTHIMTDEFGAYNNLEKYYSRSAVKHSNKQYVVGNCHTNGIENFWSNLKRTLGGSYVHVSRKHLQRYVNEVVFRFNYRSSPTPLLYSLLTYL